MHQTFYIDVDEEISSVVDRLRKSMAADNYFVVPKRALFLQSGVNLKLLKREADKIKKRVIIVTQDEMSASIAQRSGIEVQSSLDGLDPLMDDEVETEDEAFIVENSFKQLSGEAAAGKHGRLNKVGTDDYYGEIPSAQNQAGRPTRVSSSRNTKSQHNAKISSPQARGAARRVPVNGMRAPQQHAMQRRGDIILPNKKTTDHQQHPAAMHGTLRQSGSHSMRIDPQKEKTIEKMFAAAPKTHAKAADNVELGGKSTKGIVFGFILVCAVLLAGVAAFLIVPSAKITITPNVQKQKVDVGIKASVATQAVQTGDQAMIPLRAYSTTETLTLQYDATGRSESSGQKAHGSVTIYNNFSGDPQALLATTRIATADGKIFHLVKTVTVPGMAMVGGQSKSGVITADVVADEPGSDYNIDPTSFKIPGFKGGPKYDKFTVQSTIPMTGGISNGNDGSAIKQEDVDNAKTKTEAALKQKIADDINSELKQGDVSLPQAQSITITFSSPSSKVGANVANFTYTATAAVQTLIFSENDVKKIIEQNIPSSSTKDADEKIDKVDYGSADPDFNNGTLDLKVHGEVALTPHIDAAAIKSQILGKDEQRLEEILKKYPSIQNANVEFNPSFINRVSQYSSRVEIEIKAEDPK